MFPVQTSVTVHCLAHCSYYLFPCASLLCREFFQDKDCVFLRMGCRITRVSQRSVTGLGGGDDSLDRGTHGGGEVLLLLSSELRLATIVYKFNSIVSAFQSLFPLSCGSFVSHTKTLPILCLCSYCSFLPAFSPFLSSTTLPLKE